MNLVLNDRLILRQEFFGGLIHSRTTAEMWEVTDEYSTFIWALNRIGNPGRALEFTQAVFPGLLLDIDVEQLLVSGILVEGTAIHKGSREEIIKGAIDRLEESKKRNYLRSPFNVSIYLTTRCNLDCPFCFISNGKKPCGESHVSRWNGLLEEIKKAGVPFVSILGGEPTLYGGIHGVITKLDHLGIKSTITTNGQKISEEKIQLLASSKMVTTTFSLQSIEPIPGISDKGKAQKVIHNVKDMARLGKSCRINTVYMGQTVDQLLEIAKFCIQTGVEKFSLSLFVNNRNIPILTPSIREIREVGEKLRDAIDQIPGSSYLDFAVEGCLLYSAYPEITTSPVSGDLDRLTIGCEAGQTKIEILPDGRSLPCILLEARKSSENIFETGFQKFWDTNQALKDVRNYRNSDPGCMGCHYYDFCNGGCPSINIQYYGNMVSEGDPRCSLRKRKEV